MVETSTTRFASETLASPTMESVANATRLALPRMTTIFPDLSSARMLVIGDAMLDRYWFGSVDRVSPEAPVPVIAVRDVEERAGGAANVATNIAAIGGQSSLISAVGDDDGAASLNSLLSNVGVNDLSVHDASIPTTVKLRLIAQNQQLLRADFEQHVAEATVAAITSRCADVIGQTDVMVLSDYHKGTLAQAADLISIARDHGVPVVVDPKGSEFERYAGASMLTPNQKEFEAVAGRCVSDEDMRLKAHDMIADLGLDALMVTRSERGIAWFTADGAMHVSPARAREVYDVSGAGDTVIAVVATLMAVGVTGEKALVFANAAAGVVVSRLGTASVTADDINTALRRESTR